MGKSSGLPAGRPRTPSKMKVLRGTDRADRMLANEMDPKTAVLLPSPPAYLDSVAKKVWEKTTRALKELDMLVEVDYELLAAYCFNYAIIEKCSKEISKPGGMHIKYKNKAGATNLTAHPNIKIYNDALGNLNRLAAQFGFTPSSRTRISGPKKDEAEAFDNF
jgi:P27 family predicted phage terminase small subunit